MSNVKQARWVTGWVTGQLSTTHYLDIYESHLYQEAVNNTLIFIPWKTTTCTAAACVVGVTNMTCTVKAAWSVGAVGVLSTRMSVTFVDVIITGVSLPARETVARAVDGVTRCGVVYVTGAVWLTFVAMHELWTFCKIPMTKLYTLPCSIPPCLYTFPCFPYHTVFTHCHVPYHPAFTYCHVLYHTAFTYCHVPYHTAFTYCHVPYHTAFTHCHVFHTTLTLHIALFHIILPLHIAIFYTILPSTILPSRQARFPSELFLSAPFFLSTGENRSVSVFQFSVVFVHQRGCDNGDASATVSVC